MAYKKAPFFKKVNPLIQDILSNFSNDVPISKINGMSLIKVSRYLNSTQLLNIVQKNTEIQEFLKRKQLIQICKKNNASTYINSYTGKNIYSKRFQD